MFSLSDIQNDKSTCLSYTKHLTLRRPLNEVIIEAHTLCPELREFVSTNLHKFNSTKKRDKGNLGKVVEFYLFGQLPNSDSNPDLGWGADIKATHLRVLKSGHYNAKERLTITNCGKTEDYSTFEDVSSALFYILILSIFGTVFAKILFNKFVQIASPVFVSSVTYTLPVVALFWGLLDGEVFTLNQLFATIVILIGVYLANKKSNS